jgi:hypothetical protein
MVLTVYISAWQVITNRVMGYHVASEYDAGLYIANDNLPPRPVGVYFSNDEPHIWY